MGTIEKRERYWVFLSKSAENTHLPGNASVRLPTHDAAAEFVLRSLQCGILHLLVWKDQVSDTQCTTTGCYPNKNLSINAVDAKPKTLIKSEHVRVNMTTKPVHMGFPEGTSGAREKRQHDKKCVTKTQVSFTWYYYRPLWKRTDKMKWQNPRRNKFSTGFTQEVSLV